MEILLERDEFGRLACTLSHEGSNAIVTASNMPAAAEEFAAAVGGVGAEGLTECFWQEGTGEYRWMFRKVDDNIRIAVMWMTGVVTGWEHVFWAEVPLQPFVEMAMAEVERVCPVTQR